MGGRNQLTCCHTPNVRQEMSVQTESKNRFLAARVKLSYKDWRRPAGVWQRGRPGTESLGNRLEWVSDSYSWPGGGGAGPRTTTKSSWLARHICN